MVASGGAAVARHRHVCSTRMKTSSPQIPPAKISLGCMAGGATKGAAATTRATRGLSSYTQPHNKLARTAPTQHRTRVPPYHLVAHDVAVSSLLWQQLQGMTKLEREARKRKSSTISEKGPCVVILLLS